MKPASNKLLQGCRVLVVEDDAIVAFDIMRTLGGAGAVTLGPAMSLARTFEIAAAEDFDCAVLDNSARRHRIPGR
jgi:hypothetical protein